MANTKYELLKSDTIQHYGRTLYRIRARISFNDVNKGDLGGYIESEINLSFNTNTWVYGNARVFGDAQVSGNARVFGNARVCGNAEVYSNAQVYGEAQVYGKVQVSGDAQVYGNARVFGNAQVSGDAQVYGNAWTYGDAQVSGNARVCISPINLIGVCEFVVTGYVNFVQIGCKLHTITQWTEIFKAQQYLDLTTGPESYAKCELAFEYCKKLLAMENK